MKLTNFNKLFHLTKRKEFHPVERKEKDWKSLADAHWEWIEGLIRSSENSPSEVVKMSMAKYLYITGFLHGVKHGKAEDPLI